VNIFVQVCCEIDPTINVRIDRATGDAFAEPGDRLMRVGLSGRLNVAAAVSLGSVEVTAFAIDPGHSEALKHALAAGAGRAIALRQADNTSTATPTTIAALADWLSEQQPDLVIGGRFLGGIASRLGWAHLAGVGNLRLDRGTLHGIRHLERGNREEVKATLPAAVRLHIGAARPPYISRARINAVSTSEIFQESLAAEAGDVLTEIGPIHQKRERTRGAQTKRSTSSRGMDRLSSLMKGSVQPAKVAEKLSNDEPRKSEDLANEFVRYLRHYDLLPESH
jgi:electron transfer flavoprotein alpha/beta subunit